MDDDDIVRRALAGKPEPVDAHRALQELRPSMRRAYTNRRLAAVAAAAVIVTGGGAAALTIAGSPDAPTLRTFSTEADAVTPAVSPTTGVADPSGLADDASLVDPSSTSSSLRPTTTELAKPVPSPSSEPVVVEAPSPPAVVPAPSTSLPPPEPSPEPGPGPTTTVAATATSTTITSRCGQVVVTIQSGRVSITAISALAGFDASVGTDGPTSVALVFRGQAGTCEIHAELERGTLDVEVQNPERDD